MSTAAALCFDSIQQSFLVCVAVHKARHLSVLNEDTFVLVSFDGKHRHTRTIRNSDCPYFNEVLHLDQIQFLPSRIKHVLQYFVFEVHTSKENLLRKRVNISMLCRTCCSKRNRLIGEFSIDLRTIWENQSNSIISDNYLSIYVHTHGYDFRSQHSTKMGDLG